MWHDTGRATTASPSRKWMQAWEHYENPETKRRFRNLVEIAGLFDDLVPLKPRMATVDEILRFHTPAYVESIRRRAHALRAWLLRDSAAGGRRHDHGHRCRPRGARTKCLRPGAAA